MEGASEEQATLADLDNVMTTSDDPFIQAMTEAQAVIKRVTRMAQDRLAKVNDRYYQGLNTCQSANIAQAYSEIDASTAEMQKIIQDLSSKLDSAIIYKLPEEVIFLVFSYLDMDSLLSCQNTCQLWSSILASNAAQRDLWTGISVELHGTLAEVDAKWMKACRTLVKPSKLSLHVWPAPKDEGCLKPDYLAQYQKYFEDGGEADHYEDLRGQRRERCIVKRFPSSSLVEFVYEGSLDIYFDIIFWECVSKCPNLKTLHWTSHTTDDDDKAPSTYNHNSSILCRLDAFTFDVEQSRGIDRTFVGMLSQVKRLQIVRGIYAGEIRAIFDVAEEYLEEVAVNTAYGYDKVPDGCVESAIRSIFTMNRLRSFSAKGEMQNVSIAAPHTTSIRFESALSIHWPLLDSCRHTLRKLHIRLNGIKTSGRVGQELFDMPQLEVLHLDYNIPEVERYCWPISKRGDKIIGLYHDYSAASFWKFVLEKDIAKARAILPQLKCLTIFHDPMLDEEALLSLLEVRLLAGLPPIHRTNIRLANHCSSKTSRLKELQKTVPGLTFKRYEDWSSLKTPKWELTTVMNVNGDRDHESYTWEEVDACRSVLKELSVDSRRADTYIQQQLFNFPKLETLHLNCWRHYEGELGQSATALWTAILCGTTGRTDVLLQDIFPSLKNLYVITDEGFTGDVVIKLVEMRQSLGLPPIERIWARMLNKYKGDKSRLDLLQSTIPGFTYCFQT